MIELEFVDASEQKDLYRASIHTTGKLGFNMEANSYMKLSSDKYYKIAFEPNSSNIERIYLVEWENEDGVAKLYKAGQYYFLKLAHVLNRMKVDYKGLSIGFTIEKVAEQYKGHDMFILKKTRSNKRKENEKEEGSKEIDAAE